MKSKEIFELAVTLGKKDDFRSQKGIDRYMSRIKKQYDSLSSKEKQYFDKELLKHPYGDSAIHYVKSNENDVVRVLAGIDINGSDLLASKIFSQEHAQENIDLVIAHHPVGKALVGLDSVMDLQVDVYAQYGIPINIVEGLMHKRISEVSRGISPGNHYHSVDLARLLNVSFMNVHTPADNMVASYLKKYVESKKNIEYVGDVLDILMEIPEYQEATRRGTPPRLFAGSRTNRVGRIAFTEITGGTEGSPEIYDYMSRAGIGTVISMHQSEKHREKAEQAHINVIIAGHMSSDSIGMNLFLDELEKKGIEIIPIGGFIRYSRIKKSVSN
jgi:putative NIF3 family GTP cyclohydrolase 1 type 2